jgi:hypothetical protein
MEGAVVGVTEVVVSNTDTGVRSAVETRGHPCLLARCRHLAWKRKTRSVVAAASSAKPNRVKGD